MLFLKRNYKFMICLVILLVILAYATNITSIPESLILFENQELNINPIFGVNLEETIEVGANIQAKESSNIKLQASNNQKQYNLSLLGFNLKTITANIIPNTKVIPLGNLIGLKLYTQGVLVVGMSQIEGEDNQTYKPYENTGIEQGDSILEINNVEVNSTQELINCVSKCNGESIDITYMKDGNIIETQIKPVKTSSNTYKLGLWVRDAVAGVGTATFYDETTNSFAALGHGIQDVDTEEIVQISSGEFVTANIIDIEKGEENAPGKIEGTIDGGIKVGEIYSNTEYGIYGKAVDRSTLNNIDAVEVASRNEIKQGKASVICSLEDGTRKEYEVKIEEIYINNNENNKSMVVKVTDSKLLEKTGGIIQGMSGSPIIQNGKLIGALTHVLVSDPTMGYAVFGDLMIKEMREVD